MEHLSRYVSDGFETAKNGNANMVYQNVVKYLENGQLPLRSHYAFGWIIYYALHQQPDSEIVERKKLLANYLRLSVAKPHKLHSMILTEAIRLYKNAKNAAYGKKGSEVQKFSIVKFSELWDLSNLRPGDKRRKEHEGKESSSTTEKLITLYIDEIENTKNQPCRKFIGVIEEALQMYPESYTLLSQQAMLKALSCETEEARNLLRKALLFAPGKFFLWSRLAMLVPADEEPRRHVALLYKALCCPGPEQFKGKIRLALAEAFIKKNQFHYAMWELDRVKQIYESNSWHLPKAHIMASGRLPRETVASDPVALYRKLVSLADDEIYNALPIIKVRKTYHKNPDTDTSPRSGNRNFGKPAVVWRVTDAEGKNYWLQPHKFGIPMDLPLGTTLQIRIHGSRPVKAQLDPVV
ncbi:MAG: hypothetical protein HDR88_07785 [Bacteroides sp.]|nr:hypothetical protein [Bacteroides sp.]